jgi:hypothetical protein
MANAQVRKAGTFVIGTSLLDLGSSSGLNVPAGAVDEGWPAELFLDGHRRFAEPRLMPFFQEPRLPARAALVREQPLCPELVLATGG